MKRSIVALCFALAALSLTIGGAAIRAVPASAQAASASSTITGDWKVQATGSNFIVGNLHLSQVGTTVVGSAVAASGKGVLQISGQMNGTKMSGKWRAPSGETGWITLNFSGPSAFSGDWGYGGRQPSGSIVSKKIRSTSF